MAVSYLRYTPDVWPPPVSAFALPRRRLWRWILATIFYLVLIAAWVWWMTLEPKIQPPLATIPLPDGSELRLVHVARGADFNVDIDDTFGGRVRILRYPERSSFTLRSSPGTVWLVFTRFSPKTEKFSIPRLKKFSVVEGASRFLHYAKIRGGRSSQPYEIVTFETVPRRLETWPVEVSRGGPVVQGTLPNPFPPAEIIFLDPQPLPQTAHFRAEEVVSSGGGVLPLGAPATMTFTGVRIADAHDPPLLNVPRAVPTVRIEFEELRRDAFEVTHEFFDATGNTTSERTLPFSEPAWGVKIRAWQIVPSREASRPSVALAEVVSPGKGEMLALPVPETLRDRGVTDLVLVGSGSYAVRNQTLRLASAGDREGGMKLTRAYGEARRFVNSPCLLVFSTAEKSTVPLPVFQMREGETLSLSSAPETTVEWDLCLRSYYFKNASGGNFKTGGKLKLECQEPIVLDAVFYFPTPAPPPEDEPAQPAAKNRKP